MPGRKKFTNPTDEGRSKKAHIPPPPRRIAPRSKAAAGDSREVGQFTSEGGSALEKK
jgi:hypothetical protein